MDKLAASKAAIHEKYLAELVKMKKEAKDAKAALNHYISKAEEKNKEMRLKLTEDMKMDATIAVLEARIKMAEEAVAAGYDVSLWAACIWRINLARLKGQDPEELADLEDTAGKAPKGKRTPSKTLKPTIEKTPKKGEAMEVDNPEGLAIVARDPEAEAAKDAVAEEEGGNKLGDEGINDQPEPSL